MQSHQRSSSGAGSSERPHPFKVVVAFDDSATTSLSAMRTCDYVLQQLGDISVRRQDVNIHQTRTPRSRAASARAAAGADMVIVSTRDGANIPSEMQEWLDAWGTRRSTDEGALVAILNRSPEESPAEGVRNQLALLARQAHMDFISSDAAA